MIKASVVILNWNGAHFLKQFLPSVTQYSAIPGVEVVVADNASSDDSLDVIRKEFSSVRIIEFDKNYGFAGGYNKALAQLDSEYFILLNSDVEVTQDWLQPLLDFMDTHSEVGACMPKLRAHHDKSSFEYAGAAGGYIDKYGYPFCRGRVFDTIEIDNGQYDSVAEVFWATGACLVIRSQLYLQSGGLDEAFFAHMEEIDLCWRIKKMGYQIFCVPQSVVYHVGGGALPKENPRKTFLNFRNNLLMLAKNLSRKQFISILFIRFVLDGIAAVKFIVDRKFSHVYAIFRAHVNFYLKIPYVLNKRKQLKNKTFQKYNPTGQIKKSLVFQYYIKGKKVFSKVI